MNGLLALHRANSAHSPRSALLAPASSFGLAVGGRKGRRRSVDFEILRGLSAGEVALHDGAGFGGVAGADSAENFAVQVGGFLEVTGALGGFAPLVVEGGGDGLHEGGEDGIAGGLGDDAVEADVVDEVLDGFVDGGIHFGDLFGECGEVLLASAFGGEGGELAFEDAASFKHLPGLEAVQCAEEAERDLPSSGGPLATKVPTPWRTSMTPMAAR